MTTARGDYDDGSTAAVVIYIFCIFAAVAL